MTGRSRRSIYIADADWAILEAEAARSDDSVAKLVRVAVRQWIDEYATIDGVSGTARRNLRILARPFDKNDIDKTAAPGGVKP